MRSKLLLLMSVLVLFSCKKKEDDKNPTPSKPDQIEYKNQDLQGLIGGEVWTYTQGGVNSTTGGFDTEHSHNFNIVDTTQSDSCFADNGERGKAIFAIFDNEAILTVGKQPLNLDFTSDSRTVTLVVYEAGIINNIVCSEGEYEILSVDTINKLVTGRMDARYDSKNYINGNFTLKYCFWEK